MDEHPTRPRRPVRAGAGRPIGGAGAARGSFGDWPAADQLSPSRAAYPTSGPTFRQMVALASARVKQWLKKRPDWPVSVVLHLVVIAILWQFILPAAEPRVAIETIFARLEAVGDGD